MIQLPKNEKIIVLARRHWLVPLGRILMTIVLALLVTGAAWLFLNLENFVPEAFSLNATLNIALQGRLALLVWWLASLMLLLIWLQFMVGFTDYFLDVWVVTDHRILDIEQLGFFNREFSEFRLERVQDVTVDVAGILPTLLHYGDVHIQTAGEERDFIFRQVPYPHKIKDQILKAFEQKLKENKQEQHKTTREV